MPKMHRRLSDLMLMSVEMDGLDSKISADIYFLFLPLHVFWKNIT